MIPAPTSRPGSPTDVDSPAISFATHQRRKLRQASCRTGAGRHPRDTSGPIHESCSPGRPARTANPPSRSPPPASDPAASAPAKSPPASRTKARSGGPARSTPHPAIRRPRLRQTIRPSPPTTSAHIAPRSPLTIRTMALRNGDRIGPRKWSTGGQKSAELPRKEAASKTTRRTLGVHAPPRFLDPLPSQHRLRQPVGTARRQGFLREADSSTQTIVAPYRTLPCCE